VEEIAHGAIFMLHRKDISQLDNGTIQSMIIISCYVLPCCETNTAPIRSIIIHGVAFAFVAHKEAQLEMKTHA